jgi:hypothetical protein
MPSERDEQLEYYTLQLTLSAYAEERLKPVNPERRVLMEAVSRQFAKAPSLEREVTEIQRRLGTPDERPGDLERAKVRADELANMMCSVLLLRHF